jgi:endogenous inhibitor of DNA gyrase (YacG/DUF329 family)
MAMVQLKCPETGKPVDIADIPPHAVMAMSYTVTQLACPHCGKNHPWSSGHMGLALETLHGFPEARCVLVDDSLATALP